jgi:hypothetical protein
MCALAIGIGYDRGVASSERDREYLRRLGGYKADAHRAAQASHLALPLEERLARSVALMRRFAGAARGRTDDPSPFYERARRLGLYRP